MKLCPACQTEKEIEQFWKGQYLCIPCHKQKQQTKWHSRSPKKRLEQHLKYKYKIAYEDFMLMLDKQEHKCAICRFELPDLLAYENRRRGYAVDHNHDTGEVRGVLCLHCNTLLGMAKDDPRILTKAQQYLEEKGSYKK